MQCYQYDWHNYSQKHTQHYKELQRCNDSTIESTELTIVIPNTMASLSFSYLVRYPKLCCGIAIQETCIPSEMCAKEHVSLMGHTHP